MGVTLGAAYRAEGYDSAVVEGDYGMEKEVCVDAGWVLVEMHMTNWEEAQREDPVLSTVLDWLEPKRRLIRRTCLQQEGLTGFEESSEFHNSPESPISTINA